MNKKKVLLRPLQAEDREQFILNKHHHPQNAPGTEKDDDSEMFRFRKIIS